MKTTKKTHRKANKEGRKAKNRQKPYIKTNN